MTATATPDLGQLQLLDLSKVEISKFNPRQDVGDLTELAESIGQIGVLEPIVVVQRNGHYEAVAGSRRTAAARQAGLKQIPARIMSLDDAQQAAAALIENLQRKDLTPLEEAEAFRKYLDLTGCTQKELGQKIGRNPSTISNALRLLGASRVIQQALGKGAITAAHARVALELRDPERIKDLELRKGVRVDDLKQEVDEINAQYDLNGPGAVEKVKNALANAQAEFPGATITWKAPANHSEAQVVDPVVALGEPPSAIAGALRAADDRYADDRLPTLVAHEKGCGCKAYRLIAGEKYHGGGRSLKTEVTRVCIERAKYKAIKPKVKKRPNYMGSPAKAEKPLTPEQLAKKHAEERKRDESEVTKTLAALTKADKPRFASVYKRIDKGQIPADAARMILYLELCGDSAMLFDTAQAVAWDRIEKLPAKKLSELAAGAIASRFEQAAGYGYNDDDVLQRVLTFFGVADAKKAKR